jgi:hypothetical protein
MSPQNDAALRRENNSARTGEAKSQPKSPQPKSPKQKELTHADVVAGNDREREQIKQVDRTGERNPAQQGDTANIRQNTSNVNQKR